VGAEQIRAAYVPFAETLRAGGFTEPDAGWNASQIGAHISMNCELLSDLADRLHSGEDISYDNSPVVADADLLAWARGVGDLGDLADAVQVSAGRLARSYENLTAQERARPIPAVVWHEGQIAIDSPAPLGELIIGNGEFHLAMHYEQLRALLAQ
jgi:hypothetical protein